jgi:TP901 family phage tail tape measure protein
VADRTVAVDFVARHAGFTSGVQSMKRDVRDLRGQIAESARTNAADWERLGRTAVVVGGAMAAGLGAAVATFHGFQTEMNRVGALTGATGQEFDRLSGVAQELGRTTSYSASQAADALGFLAMAGFDANTAMEALPSTLTLAAAAGMDLARAADITSNILTGFGMATSDLEQANDVLVATFTSSNTSLEQLGDAMKYAAPLASAAGMQFEEVAAAIGMMGNAGIQGSMAGTALRGALTRMLEPTAQVQSKLDELGVTVRDSAGEILPLADTIEQLGTSVATAGDLMTIFGQRAGPAMAALLSQGSDELRTFTADLEASGGTAQEIADRQLEGLHGSLVRFKSAAEGAAIALGEGLAPAVSLAADVATAMFSWYASLPGPMQSVVAMTGAAAAAAMLLGGAALIATPKLVALHGSLLAVTGQATMAAAAKKALTVATVGLGKAALTALTIAAPFLAAAAAVAGLVWWLNRMEGEQQAASSAAEALAGSVGLSYEQIAAAAMEAGDEVTSTAQQFATANAETISQLRDLEQAAQADYLFRIGYDLVQHGADPDEAMEAVERLRDSVDPAIELDFDASDLDDVDRYLEAATSRISELAEEFGFFKTSSSEMRTLLADIGTTAANAFNSDPVNGFADAIAKLAGAQLELEKSGADSNVHMRELIDTFIDTTAIEGFEGRVRSVDELMRQMADGTAVVSPEVRELAQAFVEASESGAPTEEALRKVVAAAREMPGVTDEAAEAMLAAIDPTGEFGDELGEVADQLEEVRAASLDAVSGIEAYMDIQRAAVDPVFAFHRALRQADEAQEAYSEAVKEHGRSSDEAASASMNLVEAVLSAQGAAAGADKDFSEFRATVYEMAEAGLISKETLDTLWGTLDGMADEVPRYAAGYDDFAESLVDAAGNVVDLGGKMDALPDHVQTELQASDVASEVVEALGVLYDGLPEEVRAYLEATDDASVVVAYLEGRYDDLPADVLTELRARDLATSVIDTVRRRLRELDGSNAFVNVIARGGQVAGVNSRGGITQRHQGGVADGTAPFHSGKPLRRDEIPIIALRDEFVVAPGPSRRHRHLLEAINAERFHTGGVVGGGSRSFYDLGALFSMTRGASFGGATEHFRAIERMRDLYAEMTREIQDTERAERRAELVTARRTATTGDEWRQAVQQLKEHDRETKLIAQRRAYEDRLAAAEANQRLAANREQWEFDRMAAADQLRWLDARMAAEQTFNDEWMRLAGQRQQLLDREAQSARQAADEARRRADEQLGIVNQMLDEMDAAHGRYDAARAAAADRRRQELERQLSLTYGDDAWDWTAESIAAEARAQAAAVAAYDQALAEVRARGVSDDALAALGIDGPAALGQLQVLLGATDDALADLSDAIATRNAAIGRQVAAEMADAGTTLGREVADLGDQLADDLAAIGADSGRGWADAIADGLRSGIPAIEQAVRDLQATIRDRSAAEAVADTADRAAAAAPPSIEQQVRGLFEKHGVKPGRHADGSWEDPSARIGRLVADINAGRRTLAQVEASIRRLPKYHGGGTLPGPDGAEQLFLGLGGETVRTRQQEAALQTSLATAQVVVVERTIERLPEGATIVADGGDLGDVVVGTIRTEQQHHDRRVAARTRQRRQARRG